ncbi:MarR family winged helix-turn-helix transcriptional regulator [Frankia sp. AiPs1]|uniref:MarR family winged helix-turn-helix transcriptional regulator n=1 Tax=Frankia sp. AiPs1 TaxID=573493 RepID=UPI002043D749|nr:MarR family winged helix-turn-helix transcriptional regulator [Frankia sp. AiPs1]MCM3925281.1 MarR family winged helix-turn-helix transcriptional regulator [Frankia sp. AiPs1]
MPPPDTGDEVVNLLLAAGHQVRSAVDETLRASVGLTLRRFKVLQLLADSGPCRLRDLADAVAVAPRTMTETVDDLESEGLVARRSHPTDRRAVLLALTPAGREAIDVGRRRRAETVAGFTRHLTAAQRAQLVALLASIPAHVPAAPGSTHSGAAQRWGADSERLP